MLREKLSLSHHLEYAPETQPRLNRFHQQTSLCKTIHRGTNIRDDADETSRMPAKSFRTLAGEFHLTVGVGMTAGPFEQADVSL